MAKILIVDDDALFCELLADLLSASGHQPFLATGGTDAVAMLKGGCRPELVLVDLEMEQMDGFGAIDALRVAHLDATPAFVMLTASTSDDAALEARSHGAIGFLSKPILPELLNVHIARFLNDAKLVWLDDHHTVTRAA